MNIVLEKSSPVEAVLSVSLLQEDYQPAVDKKLKDYRKKANIKGFRPGMVPIEMIKKLYGKAVLIDEINHILGHKITDYIKENNLLTVGEPMPRREESDRIDWDNQTEFEFNYEIGLASDFEVDYSKIAPLKSYEIQAGEQELNETIERLRSQSGERTNPEEVAEGDMLFGVLAQESTGFSEHTGIPTKEVTTLALAKLVGAKKGDVVTVDIQKLFKEEKALSLAISKKDEELAALQGEFTFTIEDISRTEPAELNQAFFDKTLGPNKASTEEEFRTQVFAIIQDNYKRESEFRLRYDAEKALINSAAIDLPRDFLKRWLLEVNAGKFNEEQIEAEIEKVMEDLRWQLIKNRIATTEDIKVDYPEIVAKAEEMVRGQFGFAGNDGSMDDIIKKIANNYLTDKEGNGQERIMQFYNQVLDTKIGNVITEKLNKVATPIDVKGFEALDY